MSETKINIKIINLDKLSYVIKDCSCSNCKNQNMEDCPIIKNIASEVTQTSYNKDGANLNIRTATYKHDFRRALDVVRQAINNRCGNRR